MKNSVFEAILIAMKFDDIFRELCFVCNKYKYDTKVKFSCHSDNGRRQAIIVIFILLIIYIIIYNK